MPTPSLTPRKAFLELMRGFRSRNDRSKEDASQPLSTNCIFNKIQFVAIHPDPTEEHMLLEMSLGKIPTTNASKVMEKLLTMNLHMLRQFGPSIAVTKEGDILFRSMDKLSNINEKGITSALEALTGVRTELKRALTKLTGNSK